MSTLPEQGYRYLITNDAQRYGWVHPAEVREKTDSGWIDATDLTDEELHAFVMERK